MEGLMLKLKFQYFGRLMRRADSFEKTLMLGKIEGKPDLSSLPLRRFTEDQSVCKQFTDKQDFFLQR